MVGSELRLINSAMFQPTVSPHFWPPVPDIYSGPLKSSWPVMSQHQPISSQLPDPVSDSHLPDGVHFADVIHMLPVTITPAPGHNEAAAPPGLCATPDVARKTGLHVKKKVATWPPPATETKPKYVKNYLLILYYALNYVLDQPA